MVPSCHTYIRPKRPAPAPALHETTTSMLFLLLPYQQFHVTWVSMISILAMTLFLFKLCLWFNLAWEPTVSIKCSPSWATHPSLKSASSHVITIVLLLLHQSVARVILNDFCGRLRPWNFLSASSHVREFCLNKLSTSLYTDTLLVARKKI